ncbi:MAG TPA: hypothetical protein DCZ94_09400 [Lentisphaeria bacterium]|nr:MAG: hypothetical protein A2X48_18245 [Lentisphaerae bacterium GWF2_49_21]HBC87156.1 hypothetical protein [Lentisphaeria bacterium]
MPVSEWNKTDWDNFVDSSPQGTIFNKSIFLECYGKPVRYISVLKGNEILGAMAYVESENGIEINPFQMYSGYIFKDHSDLKEYRRNEICFYTAEAVSSYLFEKYEEIAFLNHWSVSDLRPFLWHNYHCRENGYYHIAPYYTSLLEVENPEDLSNYCKGRKHSLSKGMRANCTTVESTEIGVLDELHTKTFGRQGIIKSEHEQKYLLTICSNLMKAGSAKLFITRVGDKHASASLFLIDRFRVYYLFGATDPEYRNSESGTKNMYDSFCMLKGLINFKEVDFVGINSPARGTFKLSFGGRVVRCDVVRKAGASADKAASGAAGRDASTENSDS